MEDKYYKIRNLSPNLWLVTLSRPKSIGIFRGKDYSAEENAANYFYEAAKTIIEMGNKIINIVSIDEGINGFHERYSTTSAIFVFVEPVNKHPLGN